MCSSVCVCICSKLFVTVRTNRQGTIFVASAKQRSDRTKKRNNSYIQGSLILDTLNVDTYRNIVLIIERVFEIFKSLLSLLFLRLSLFEFPKVANIRTREVWYTERYGEKIKIKAETKINELAASRWRKRNRNRHKNNKNP